MVEKAPCKLYKYFYLHIALRNTEAISEELVELEKISEDFIKLIIEKSFKSKQPMTKEELIKKMTII